MSAIRKIAVIGAGQMGGGIAQTAAAIARLPVILFDANPQQLNRQKKFIGMKILLINDFFTFNNRGATK